MPNITSGAEGGSRVGNPADVEQPTVLREAAALFADVGDDTDLLKRLMVIFADEAPRLRSELAGAVARGDADALEHAAHAIKGSVALWATGGVFVAARELERMGRENDMSHAAAVSAVLDRELGSLLRLLDEWTLGI